MHPPHFPVKRRPKEARIIFKQQECMAGGGGVVLGSLPVACL